MHLSAQSVRYAGASRVSVWHCLPQGKQCGPEADSTASAKQWHTASASGGLQRLGFTLVEMLVVITIIGILAGLIVGAAIRVRAAAKKAVIKTEISQFEMALQAYKQKYGEFPPDFANVGNSIPAVATDAKYAIIRHLRKAFPRYTPVGNAGDTNDWDRFVNDVKNNYGVLLDPNNFDAASALVFWLGGLPETAGGAAWKPAGFSTDPQFPFKPGLPRTDPFFEFKTERLKVQDPIVLTRLLRFYPPQSDLNGAPYVYFRAQRIMSAAGRYEYGYLDTSNKFAPLGYAHTSTNVAVAYLDATAAFTDPTVPANERVWRNPDTYQIVCPGLDGFYGGNEANFRYTKVGKQIPAAGGTTTVVLDDGNMDNITNFSNGTLEDEMQE